MLQPTKESEDGLKNYDSKVMTHPKETLWERSPHTAAKHRILQRYLQAWFPILLQGGYRQVTYLEGFAGPGGYSGGEAGSPIIVLDEFLSRPQELRADGRALFAFIEKRPDRASHLAELVAARGPLPSGVRVEVEVGAFDEKMEGLLGRIGAWGRPVFANLDAWGADVPFVPLARLGENPNSEVLVTLVSDFFARFAKLDDLPHGDRQFGSTEWRGVAEVNGMANKRRFLLEKYRQTLMRAGFPYGLAFELLDDQGHEVALTFGTKSQLGIEKMKESMWKVDSVYGVRFRDPRDPDQLSFGMEDREDLAPLRRILLARLSDQRKHKVESLREFTLLGTIYRKAQASAVLRSLRNEGLIEQRPPGRLVETSRVWIA